MVTESQPGTVSSGVVSQCPRLCTFRYVARRYGAGIRHNPSVGQGLGGRVGICVPRAAFAGHSAVSASIASSTTRPAPFCRGTLT